LVWARCLTAMREKMNTDINARVLLGGRLEGFMGRYPGLAEEALLAKRSGKADLPRRRLRWLHPGPD